MIAVDLMRELSTEALAFVLPLGFATDRVGVDSLASAILLGLEITTGGSPDHLGIASVPHPVADGAPGETRPALLLHDTVPGGTGYLTDHDDSSRLWNLLIRTGQHLESCPCRAEGKDMCPDCLRPHAVSAEVTRAAALHAIGQLLGREDNSAQDTEGVFAQLDPEVPLWEVTDEAVRAGTGESPLEVRFRAALAEFLDKKMAVRTTSDPSGAPALEIDGGRWRIRPQLDARGTRPDFTCLRPGGRSPIAIFTDGRSYHASREHNRLADDADKRARLRAAGYRVISVGVEDLDGPWNPAWLNEATVAQLKNGSLGASRAGGVTDPAIDAWRGGPMALLETMLSDDNEDPETSPTTAALAALADSAWGPLIVGARLDLPLSRAASLRYENDPEEDTRRTVVDPLWKALSSLQPDAVLPAPSRSTTATSCSVLTIPHLALAVQFTGTSTTGMALVLDDSDEALGTPEHPEAWLAWLRLSNVLALAQVPVDITTTSRALAELRARAQAEVAVADVAGSPAAMSDLGWDDVDQDLTPEPILTLLPHLAAAGLPHEGDGVEVGGVMTDLSWAAPKVAVLAEPQDGDEEALTAAGWRVVVTSDDPARTATDICALIPELLEGH